MASKGSPREKYPYKTDPKMKKKSYEIRLAAQFGDAASKKRLASYNRQRRERMLEANNKDWMVDGRAYNRYNIMDVIVTRVAAGESLPHVCDHNGMPSILTVYSWFKNHPNFEKAMVDAEAVRAHILGEKALEIAMDTDRENVAADKLKVETLSKFAARGNARFQDKQTIQTVDEYSTMTEQQIKDRIQALLRANPELTLPSVSDARAPIEAEISEPNEPSALGEIGLLESQNLDGDD
jgi:hypothetical protein